MSVDVVLQLQKRVTDAKNRQAKAEAVLAQADANLKTAQEGLQTFGVSTPEEAAALLQQLTAEFESEKAAVEARLLEIENNAPRTA